MEKSLFRRWFSRAPAPAVESAAAPPESETADGQFQRGLNCANSGQPTDYGQAAKWYLKAAQQNHALAQFNLGIMCSNGQGSSRNEIEAEQWFSKSARQGDAGAQHQLGMRRYRASISDAPANLLESRIEAYKWFVLAAAQGYRGSEAARDMLALQMSHEDVAEANQRVSTFTQANRKN